MCATRSVSLLHIRIQGTRKERGKGTETGRDERKPGCRGVRKGGECNSRRRGQEIAPPADWAHQNYLPSNGQLMRVSRRVILASSLSQPGLTSCSAQPQHALPPSRQTFHTHSSSAFSRSHVLGGLGIYGLATSSEPGSTSG